VIKAERAKGVSPHQVSGEWQPASVAVEAESGRQARARTVCDGVTLTPLPCSRRKERHSHKRQVHEQRVCSTARNELPLWLNRRAKKCLRGWRIRYSPLLL
jgi:hypothetical protein